MSNLSMYEQETIILMNRADADATVFTYDPVLKRRLKEYAEKYPDIAFMKFDNGIGGVTYVLPKVRISLRLTAPYSEERKKAASEYAKEHGFQKGSAESAE